MGGHCKSPDRFTPPPVAAPKPHRRRADAVLVHLRIECMHTPGQRALLGSFRSTVAPLLAELQILFGAAITKRASHPRLFPSVPHGSRSGSGGGQLMAT